MKKVVVFGATGNLGANISMHLHKLGYEVVPVGHRKMIMAFLKVMVCHIILWMWKMRAILKFCLKKTFMQFYISLECYQQ